MNPARRAGRFPRCATFSATPKNPLVWTIGVVLGFLLLIAVTDMLFCGIEEANKPEMVCSRCALWSLGTSGGGREVRWFAPNRTCPGCNRAWSDYNPYYWKWLRQPIRNEFGRLEF